MPPSSPQVFLTTHWTMVLNARDGASPQSAEALERLCRTYWHPLYFFARRKGSSPEDAQDSVQGFFQKLLVQDSLQTVGPEKGRFRTFLLTAFTNFLANEWDGRKCLKRGGTASVISLDGLEAEERYSLEPVELLTPEKLFERGWAETVVQLVVRRLRAEYTAAGEAERFEALEPCLMGFNLEDGYAAQGQKLGLGGSALKSTVRRMRLRFASVLREELAQTLSDPADVDTEMRHLLEALM